MIAVEVGLSGQLRFDGKMGTRTVALAFSHTSRGSSTSSTGSTYAGGVVSKCQFMLSPVEMTPPTGVLSGDTDAGMVFYVIPNLFCSSAAHFVCAGLNCVARVSTRRPEQTNIPRKRKHFVTCRRRCHDNSIDMGL